ncbi:40S ribosomal protein S11 [Dictyocoela muelleri]|nr:40S ribosomal protein S11 [Dictyocoela muelleri]
MSEIIEKTKTFPQQSQVYNNPYSKEKKRFCRESVLGFSAPETAINGTYIDKKCPFTGEVVVRNNILRGEVLKMKQPRTIVVLKKMLHYVKKYKRYERRNKKFSVHLSPCFQGIVQVGDIVTCGEVRPLSKTKRFVVLHVDKKKD